VFLTGEETRLVGQRYADLAGIDTDASAFQRRKEYLSNLQKTAPASVGGQRKALNTAVQHGTEVLDAFDGVPVGRLLSAPGSKWCPQTPADALWARRLGRSVRNLWPAHVLPWRSLQPSDQVHQ
jgi:hypothetical protein